MNQPKMSITEFVRGMAWHDIGKPFALGTYRHSALGYWLLNLAEHPGEALVALAHGHSSQNDVLHRYFSFGGKPLPGILSLCNALDRLAASVYSLQSRASQLQPKQHSFQNPFSRLPIHIQNRENPFVVPNNNLVEDFELPLWTHLRRRLPDEWSDILSDQGKKDVESRNKALPDPKTQKMNKDILNVLLPYMRDYPERTYPAVNDTSLTQHCRLSGIFAFVVYSNIQRGKDKGWLDTLITFEDQEIKQPITDVPTAIRKNLKATLLRISFEGHRKLYENAARVDDLHGARELTDKLRTNFKSALAIELKTPDLVDFLTISESQFDLVYLIPQTEISLKMLVHNAYATAVEQVSDEIVERLERSFPKIGDQKSQLNEQLSNLSYGLRIIPVEVPKTFVFDEFAAEFGQNLLKAYRNSLDYVTFPQVNPTSHDETVVALPPDETCQVCGNYPILVPPTNLKTSEAMTEWQRHLNYAGHIFRGENERICLSCVARRTLAYGKIAKRMDHLVHPLLKRVKPGLWQVVSPPEDSISPPPLPVLMSTVQLDPTRDDELVSMGAFYVRHRRTQGSVDTSELDIFPTTSYAADVNSNVILLSLRPTEELFSTYSYIEAIKNATQDEPLTHPDFELWQQTFIQFYNKVKVEIEAQEEEYQQGKRKNPPLDLLEPIGNVHPHLARVMERIQHLKQFYEILWETLTKENIHTLPLDLDFPTLRLLLPADRLVQALRVLDRVMTETLFSATYPVENSQTFRQERQALHNLLSQLVPSLLHGTAILFKQKYALYLALEAERDLFRQLVDSDQETGPGRRQYDGDGHAEPWYGLRLALSDLRGTLSGAAPMLAQLTYGDLGDVLRLAQTIDRRTVTGRAAIIDSSAIDQHASADEITQLADALTLIRGKRIGKSDQVKELLDDHEKKFKPVHFIKTATRT